MPSKYSDAVSRILMRVALQEGHEGGNNTIPSNALKPHLGPLTNQELAELTFLCNTETAASGNNCPDDGFATVEGDQLVSLIELLDRHVNLAVAVNLVQQSLQHIEPGAAPSVIASEMDKFFKHEKGKDGILCLRNGLEAAAIVLFIASTDNVDCRAINEDAIKVSITLMRSHLAKHLLPALNQTSQFISTGSSCITSPRKFHGDSIDASPDKKRRRNSGATFSSSEPGTVPAKDLKKLYNVIVNDSMHVFLTLMERLERLVDRVPLDDQQILLLTSGCLPAFEIDCSATPLTKATPPARHLQILAIAILASAFRKYPKHREILLEDLFPVMLYLPTGKRSLRAYPLRYSSASAPEKLQHFNAKLIGSLLLGASTSASNGMPEFIQMLTALVLSLVQSCVQRPVLAGDNEDDKTTNDDTHHSVAFRSGLITCHEIADAFVAQLLKRCTRNRGGPSEFRSVLQNFVEDLLVVLLIPEYPAAAILLSSLQRQIIRDLTMASPIFSSPTGISSTAVNLEQTYLNSAFEVLGKICAVQARVLAAARDHPISMTTKGFHAHATHSTPDTDDEFDVLCYCKSKHQDTMLIKCDHCHTTYHGPCVGINSESDAPADEWFCDACTLGKIAAREASRCKEDEADYVDGDFAMHQTFQATIAHRLGIDNLEDAIHFHLARWIYELEEKGLMNDIFKGRPRRIVARLLENWDTRGPAAEYLSAEGSCRVILALMANNSVLMKSFRSQIGFLIKLMTDESAHMLRKLSLKVIEKTVEGDQNLMLLPIINKAVSRRLTDESISVREAAVSLIGSYAVKSPSLANAYHNALVGCLTDPGVSVRKRSVRIFQQILVQNPRYRGRSMVCNIMLERAADPKEEDAVRDLVDDLFCELWLRSSTKKKFAASAVPVVTDSDSSVQIAIESTPGVVTPTSSSPATKRRSMNQADIAAEQMMEVVRAAGSADNLEALLRKFLKGSTNADSNKKIAERAKRQELGMKQCTELVNALFELLLVVEEQREIRSCVGKDIASTLLAISIFAKLSPHSILPSHHLESLFVYLKADNGVEIEDEAAIICATCEVLVWCSPVFDLNFVNKLAKTSLYKDLVVICKKFGVKVIASAIRVFAYLAFHPVVDSSSSFFSRKLLDLAKTFYSYLCTKESVEDFSLGGSKQKFGVHRALTVLGLICENHTHVTVDALTWGNEVTSENATLLPQENLSWDIFTCACYRLFTHFLQKRDILTKCKALAALKGIFIAQPQLLLQLDHVGLFDEVMADSAGIPLQLEALECWRNILTAEEKRVDSGEADAKMDASGNITVGKKISGDQDGDATLFGGVLTSHSYRLYEMIHARNSEIRFSTLKLIAILLRQGLLNPNEVVPHLLALQGDIEQNDIRSLALQLLMAEAEKRPDTLRQRVRAGVKQAYMFQRTIYSKKLHVSALVTHGTGKNVAVESIFNSVFRECIISNRKQREGLYKSLLSLFEIDDQIAVTSMDLSLLAFATQILAHLPYNNNSDLLFIIYSITTTITITGYQTVDRISDFLRAYGLANTDEFADTLACEDLLEMAATKKFPSRAKEARAVASTGFDTEQFCSLLREASSWVLLLRLKRWLRDNYNLSLSRCLNYEPGQKEKPNDKFGCKKLCETYDSSIPVSLFSKGADMDMDALIRHYADFRRMMRDETGAASSSCPPEDDKGELEVHFNNKDDVDEMEEEKSPTMSRSSKRKNKCAVGKSAPE